MKDVFVADAHLEKPEDLNYRLFLRFLEDLRGDARTLFLLGDIFEFWVGYQHVAFSSYVPVLEALRALRESGTEIVYVEGNHDFHMGPWFVETLGCRVLPDGGVIHFDNRKIFIAHGDLANPRDTGYRFLRSLLRSVPLRLLFKIFPPDWTWAIAHWSSDRSRNFHSAKQKRWDTHSVVREYAEQFFAEGCDTVIMGHFHDPWVREKDGRTIIALGDWIKQFSYAVYEDDIFSLRSYESR